MQIRTDPLAHPAVHALLAEHLDEMHTLSPRESVHALGLDRLRRPEIAFWTAWDGETLLGCGALRALSPTHGEVKSMRTARAHRRRGVAAALLEHIVREARARGYTRLSLETGAQEAFAPARALYRSRGFVDCGPFGDYHPDPNSVFLTLTLPHDDADGERH